MPLSDLPHSFQLERLRVLRTHLLFSHISTPCRHFQQGLRTPLLGVRSARLARWRTLCGQRQQLSPRNHQSHLIEKLTLARALGHKLESGLGKAHLFHESTISDQAVTGLTFTDIP